MSGSEPLAFVISPQPWGGFHVSKHHYAVALAERGWRVVFVDPPTNLGALGAIELSTTEVPGIQSLRYQPFFPYKLKFHSRWAFDLLMQRQARRLVAAAGRPDLVWDFDNAYQFCDLSVFGAGATLFHLVDDVSVPNLGDKRADYVFYLHPYFCQRAGVTPNPDYEIGHGLGNLHAAFARQPPRDIWQPGRPHIGFIGNLAANWLDWQEVAQIVEQHSLAQFTFWGPLPSSEEANRWLAQLIAHPRTRFPGFASQAAILEESGRIDVWLLPFDGTKVPGGRPINSHKVLEYLSTGRVVAMTWLEAYDGNELVEMAPRFDGSRLSDLVRRVLADLARLNEPELMARRRAFALERTYDRQLAYIQSHVPQLRSLKSNAA